MHTSVMLNEVTEYLAIKPGARIIDATLNGGGHTKEILGKYSDVKILGIEIDPNIIQEFKSKIKNYSFEDRMIVVNDSYINIEKIIQEYSFRPDGIIFDLGLSSWHYEGSGRGFSFKKDESLDMRFNPLANKVRAWDIVNTFSQKDLEKILKNYGEERFAPEIANNIVRARGSHPILTTNDLVSVINLSVPGWYKKRKIHQATKTFQALRIAVNNELENVEKGIESAINAVKSGGRIIVISFHGLEDKIVREIFKKKVKEGVIRRVIKGTLKPGWDEIKVNRRSRSAKMKVIEKI